MIHPESSNCKKKMSTVTGTTDPTPSRCIFGQSRRNVAIANGTRLAIAHFQRRRLLYRCFSCMTWQPHSGHRSDGASFIEYPQLGQRLRPRERSGKSDHPSSAAPNSAMTLAKTQNNHVPDMSSW